MGRLDELDLTARLTNKEYDARLAAGQRRLLSLRLDLGGHLENPEIGPGVLVVFEGSDAGGKGGTIRRIVEPLDPRHYRVSTFSKPTFDEKRKHFLWRFWADIPGLGGFALFDRSWYGRVLVERVEGFASREEWMRSYDEIVQFERSLVMERVIVVKFWLQVSQEEQLKRFESRRDDPLRSWKLVDEDWRNREKWPQYKAAIEDMFAMTDHETAPWNLISGEQKKWARVQFLETLNDRIVEGIERADG